MPFKDPARRRTYKRAWDRAHGRTVARNPRVSRRASGSAPIPLRPRSEPRTLNPVRTPPSRTKVARAWDEAESQAQESRFWYDDFKQLVLRRGPLPEPRGIPSPEPEEEDERSLLEPPLPRPVAPAPSPLGSKENPIEAEEIEVKEVEPL